MFLAHSGESQDARVAAKWHRVGGRCEEGRWERLEGAGEPHLCQLQLCDRTQFSELQFPQLQNTLCPAGCQED